MAKEGRREASRKAWKSLGRASGVEVGAEKVLTRDVTRLRAWDLSPWKEEIWERAVERVGGEGGEESRTTVGGK